MDLSIFGIFLSGSSLSGCDNWTDVTELVPAQSRSCLCQPITDGADCSLSSHWFSGSRTGGKQRLNINVVTMTTAQATGQVDRTLAASRKIPGM